MARCLHHSRGQVSRQSPKSRDTIRPNDIDNNETRYVLYRGVVLVQCPFYPRIPENILYIPLFYESHIY